MRTARICEVRQGPRIPLGGLLRRCRIEAGLSQEMASNRVGKDHSYLSRIERAHQMVDFIDLVEILKAMDISPRDFFNRYFDECGEGK